MCRKLIGLFAVIALSNHALAQTEPQQPRVIMDENLWVTFYDLPSRRFREIRSDFVRRDFATAARNLVISANFLNVEADRAIPAVAERLHDVSARLTKIAEIVDDTSVTVADLDSLFGRAHWLLAQHYLDMARRSRDVQQYRNEGLYLWATTHHMERAVLWSNARVDRELLKTLDALRDLADRLQDAELAAEANRNRPVVRAEKVLRTLGEQMDRPVVLPDQ
jgi:hypothetical protein